MTRDEIIQQAQETYDKDGIDFDDYPNISVSEHGTWVQAWVWVPHVPEDHDGE